jgi:hypothetical protein
MEAADFVPDVPCAPIGVACCPVMTMTLSADSRAPLAVPEVTVTVMAAELPTTAHQAAACPSTPVGMSVSFR